MTVTLNVRIKGAENARKMLDGIVRRGKNPEIALRAVASMMRNDVLDHLQKEVSDKGRWPKLAKSTLAWKKEKGYHGMLKNTGNLRSSIIPDVRRKQAIVQAGGIGKKGAAGYAVEQNEGKGRMPARKYLWLSPKALHGIIKFMTRFLSEGR